MKILCKVIISIILFHGLWLNAQNPNWIISPKFLKYPGPLPAPLPTDVNGYDGVTTTKYSSNMVSDKNGKPLFFIVDDQIYNKDGALTDILTSNLWFSGIAGNCKTTIVPDPGNCQRFYIFSSPNYISWANVNGVPPAPAPPGPPVIDHSVPCFYSIYDLEATSPYLQTPKSGALVTKGTVLSDYLDLAGGYGSMDDVDYFSTYFASSTLKNSLSSSPYRMIFIYRGKDLLALYKLDAQGLHPVTEIAVPSENNSSLVDNHPDSRAEMEIYELPNGKYRIALIQKYSYPNQQRVLTTFEIDENGIITPNSAKFLTAEIFDTSNPIYPHDYDPAFHGIEFSPNGQYIYYTRHFEQIFYQEPPQGFIGCWDYANNTSVYLSQIPTTQAKDFEQSQIEIDINGNLYFVTSNRMARISGADSPASASWSNNILSINYPISYPSTSSDATATYLLPDQIDKEDYSQFAPITYDIETPYTANDNLTTWTQNSNPWNINSSNIYFEDNLIIPAGRTLTIQNMTFHFGPDARVIIEQGAKLKLDHATLTNAKLCGDQQDFWQGVEVWGTLNQNQYPTNHPTYQGMLVLTNQSSIENAHVGATNWKVDDIGKLMTGMPLVV